MVDTYDDALEYVAADPGVTAEDFPGDPALLEQAVAADEVVEMDDKHWIVRKGRFAFDRYDHPVG